MQWLACEAGLCAQDEATCLCSQDAARYLQDVLVYDGTDEDAAVALDQCMADLEQFQSMRPRR